MSGRPSEVRPSWPGTGVTSGVSLAAGVGAAVAAASLGAVDWLVFPQAVASSATTATTAISARGPDRIWFIAMVSSLLRDRPSIS
jgi:hypothetical protein